MNKKKIKVIATAVDKCTGCRSCEMACSAFHSVPRYSSLNPARSRIRVLMDEVKDIYVPIRGGNYAPAECSGRNHYSINAKEYSECAFCRSSACPSRDWFKEPDTGLPLQCDLCKNTPPLPEPMCVQACKFGALTYEEREAETQEGEEEVDEIEAGLAALADKHGLQKIMEAASRMSKKS